MIRSTGSRRVALLLLATLLLRAAIPDGYMPSRVGSGLLFELCPSGVPAGFMEALAGAGSGHHHGHEAGDETHFDASQCPIGHFLSMAALVDEVRALDVEPAPATSAEWAAAAPASIARPLYRSRGPPPA
jgi:hypothetical protein